MTYRFIRPFGLKLLQYVFLLEALIRGIIYMVDQRVIVGIEAVQHSAPLEVWGAAIAAFAVLAIYGEALMSGCVGDNETQLSARAWPSFIGHGALCILYVTLGLATIVSIAQGERTLSDVPASLAAIAYVHWLYARRRKANVT